MAATEEIDLPNLPETVEKALKDFAGSAKTLLGTDLFSVVLYGSGAEGRLRPTSDVNVVLVLEKFDPAKVDQLRESLRVNQAAIRLSVMFLLKSEIQKAADFFAVKFSDMHRRHRVLVGQDPFADLNVSRGSMISRLKQVLFNLVLRMRNIYAYRAAREEQIALAIADDAGPLRACAATLLELEGQPLPPTTKEALQKIAASLPNKNWEQTLAHLSEAREKRVLPPGVAPKVLLELIELAQDMQTRAEKLH